MNCNSHIKRCKAACCGIVPIPEIYLRLYKNKIYDKVFTIKKLEKNMIIAETLNLKCIFLNKKNQCSIYDNRPEVCKMFGNESHILLTCLFQDKNGISRNKKDKKIIKEKANEYITNLLDISKKIKG